MKHKKWLYLYVKGPCDECACTICESECDRNISPCKRCDNGKRTPILACITFGERVKQSEPYTNCSGKKISSRGKILRGIVPDDWGVE